MQNDRRQLLRLAHAMHHANTRPLEPPLPLLPEQLWADCRDLLRRLTKVERSGWRAAAREARRQLRSALGDLAEELAELQVALTAPPPAFASPQEIFQDLLTLEQEFQQVDWDLRDATLTVTTEPITLADVWLGRFAVQLRWKSLAPLPRIGCYQVLALEPSPAEKDEDITHPHVQGGMLCEGEAHGAIRQALVQGRLLDFFSIVRQVLETYNSGSPYVAIEDWFGVRCDACDAWLAADDVTVCCGCENALCGECRLYCCGCSDGCCARCLSACSCCEQDFCSGCLHACVRCDQPACSDCLDTHRICENCNENEHDDGPSAEVQPHCLGETAVSA
jgi:hypothetical protein